VLLLGVLLTVFAISYVAVYLPSVSDQAHTRDRNTQSNFLNQCLLPLVAAAFALSIAWAWMRNTRQGQEPPALLWFVGFGALVHVLAGLCARYRLQSMQGASAGNHRTPSENQGVQEQRRFRERLRDFAMVVIAGVVGGLFVGTMAGSPPFRDPGGDTTGYYVCFAAPLLLVLYFAATSLYVGLDSYNSSDADDGS
jgi:hypothetical protein